MDDLYRAKGGRGVLELQPVGDQGFQGRHHHHHSLIHPSLSKAVVEDCHRNRCHREGGGASQRPPPSCSPPGEQFQTFWCRAVAWLERNTMNAVLRLCWVREGCCIPVRPFLSLPDLHIQCRKHVRAAAPVRHRTCWLMLGLQAALLLPRRGESVVKCSELYAESMQHVVWCDSRGRQALSTQQRFRPAALTAQLPPRKGRPGRSARAHTTSSQHHAAAPPSRFRSQARHPPPRPPPPPPSFCMPPRQGMPPTPLLSPASLIAAPAAASSVARPADPLQTPPSS